MKTVNDSVNAFALLLMVSAAAAIVMPLVSRGQGDSQNAPPHRITRSFYLTTTQHTGSEGPFSMRQRLPHGVAMGDLRHV